MKTLTELSRSPYVIGTGLGVLNAFAFASAGRGLGVSTAFESAAAIAGRELAPDATRINAYIQQRDEAPKIDWESLLVVGVAAGSALAALAAKERTTAAESAVPAMWEQRFGPSPRKRYAAAFLGGAAMMFGARMAKGCTSGHGLTGAMQLAVSSWVFTPLMFATAAATAHLIYGKENP